MWTSLLYRLCQFIHLYDPVKEEVHPDKAYPRITKQRLESIVHPFRFCRSTTLLVVSLEKNLMEFHILLLNKPRRFSTNPFTFNSPFLCNQHLKN